MATELCREHPWRKYSESWRVSTEYHDPNQSIVLRFFLSTGRRTLQEQVSFVTSISPSLVTIPHHSFAFNYSQLDLFGDHAPIVRERMLSTAYYPLQKTRAREEETITMELVSWTLLVHLPV
jgi:hypothetical protein